VCCVRSQCTPRGKSHRPLGEVFCTGRSRACGTGRSKGSPEICPFIAVTEPSLQQTTFYGDDSQRTCKLCKTGLAAGVSLRGNMQCAQGKTHQGAARAIKPAMCRWVQSSSTASVSASICAQQLRASAMVKKAARNNESGGLLSTRPLPQAQTARCAPPPEMQARCNQIPTSTWWRLTIFKK